MRKLMLVLASWVTLEIGIVHAQKDPEPLPAGIVESWKVMAGAEAGWMGMGPNRYRGFGFTTRPQDLTGPPVVPAFKIHFLAKGQLSKLPIVDKPFGLCLSLRELTAADLKELANQKQLVALDLTGTVLTDEIVKELASLKQLTSLALYDGFGTITDGNLKNLAALKQLTLLNLEARHVTEMGLKELVALKQLTSLSL